MQFVFPAVTTTTAEAKEIAKAGQRVEAKECRTVMEEREDQRAEERGVIMMSK